MRSCDLIQDRFYDEDCRRALADRAELPADVAAHLSWCDECRLSVEALRDDTLTLGEMLSEDAPPASRAQLRSMLAAACPPPAPLLDWRSALVWALTGGAVAGCAIVFAAPQLSLAWQAAIVVAAVSLGAATDVTWQGLAT